MAVPTTDFADIIELVRDAIGINDSEEILTDAECAGYIRAGCNFCRSQLGDYWNFRTAKTTSEPITDYVTPALDLQGPYATALVRATLWRISLNRALAMALMNNGDYSAEGVSESGAPAVTQLRMTSETLRRDATQACLDLLGYNRSQFGQY